MKNKFGDINIKGRNFLLLIGLFVLVVILVVFSTHKSSFGKKLVKCDKRCNYPFVGVLSCHDECRGNGGNMVLVD